MSARKAGPASKLILFRVSCGVCCVSSEIISRPLIGRNYECSIVIEVIDVDELDGGKISAAAENKTILSCFNVKTNCFLLR